jgi:hypothetical protein
MTHRSPFRNIRWGLNYLMLTMQMRDLDGGVLADISHPPDFPG